MYEDKVRLLCTAEAELVELSQIDAVGIDWLKLSGEGDGVNKGMEEPSSA